MDRWSEQLPESQAPGRNVWKDRAGILVVVLLVALAIAYVVQNLMNGKTNTKKMVTTIKLMPDTPPPPPPPPPKEPPKEQPKEIKIEQPKPQEAPQPPSEVLKMEGAAGDGDSPFESGKVTNDYKGVTIGNTSRFKSYLGGLQKSIRDELSRNERLRKGEYKAVVSIWIDRNGDIERFELLGSSGEPDVDAAMKKVLSSIKHFVEPPSDMAQPIKLRISSR